MSAGVPSASNRKRLFLQMDGGCARITLDHPPLNVIDFQMMDELLEALQLVERHGEISVVLLRGQGRGFSAGVDVAIHTPDKVPTMLAKFHGVIGALSQSPKITIAEAHGACFGGGAELAMICDMVFTTTTARWGFPEIMLGCYPPVACAALAALVGQKKAAQLIFTGRGFTGEEAAQWGLANGAFSGSEIEKALQKEIDALLGLSPAALTHAKKAFYAWNSIHLDKGLARAEKIYVEELMRTEDAAEGILAWKEKRAPLWKGR